MRKAAAILKLAAFGVLCALVVPTQGGILFFTRGPVSYILPQLWHASVCATFGIRRRVIGAPAAGLQTLYMSNHLSYMDIPVLGSLVRASFVAKSEVEGWPLFGFLAKLQQTAFIQRKPSEAAQQKTELQARIDSGESLIIFPEGTSTDGRDVLPFKSSLFSLAYPEKDEVVHVQPITITLSDIDEHPPNSQEDRDLYAWHRDMDTPLHIHLWRFAQTKGAVVTVRFHEPLNARVLGNRKILAQTCHDRVTSGLPAADAVGLSA